MALTEKQRERLEYLCDSYGVEFRETDYLELSDLPPGWVQGWVGGRHHGTAGTARVTLYVGVSPEGESHS